MCDVDNLTGPQRAALGQLQAITNGDDIPSEIAILSSVNWDVQRAAETIFDAQMSRTRPKIEQMQIDDSAQRQPFAHSPRHPPSPIVRLGLNIVSVVTFPISISFNIISHLVHFIFRVLRIPFPRINFTSLSFNFPNRARPPVIDDPASAADRLVRALEEETGAQVLSRARASRRDDPGPSAAASVDDPLFDDSRRLLPDFWLGSYESALDVARREARILCVILLSAEHDDVPGFRRNDLTDPVLVRMLTEYDILVWAGEVRERDAYQASLKLTTTTYPFVAFIALQSRVRAATGNTTGPSLTVLSRHAGAASTAAAILTQHISGTLIPRHQPFLLRLQAQERARVTDRALRAEQDAAFAAAQNADAQRILRRRAEEAERVAREEAAQAASRAEQRAAAWRVRWRCRALQRLDLSGEGTANVRIGVRVPDGRRAVRWFREKDAVADVYAWVDGVLAQEQGEDEDESEDVGMEDTGIWEAAIPAWPFRLAVAFPRTAVPCVAGQLVGEIAALRGGGNLVVEGVALPSGDASDGSGSEDDG